MTDRIRYLSTLALPEEWLQALRTAVPEADVLQVTAQTPQDVPADIWWEVEALHTSSVFPEPEMVPSLRWVQLDTSGVDHVRHTSLWSTDVPITTIGGISPTPLAEYVLWAVLGSAHRLPELLAARSRRSWPDPVQRRRDFTPRPLAGSTAVVVGYGRIGRRIGDLLAGHGIRVVGVTRSGLAGSRSDAGRFADFSGAGGQGGAGQGGAGRGGAAQGGGQVLVVGPSRLREVFADADYVVVVAPLTDATRGLVDAAAIAALKPGAVVVNVARGGVVDEVALLAALRSGALGGVVLDVFEQEPLAPDSPWWDEPGCLLTPHVAGLAPHYERDVLELVTQNLHRLREGAALLNVVDRCAGY